VPVLGDSMERPAWGTRARAVDVGNPHLVLLGEELDDVEVALLGPELERGAEGGVNVEFIAITPGTTEVMLRVWERGVGETLACGTGSVAAAAAARDWGLVGSTVRVHNPGGALEVILGRREAEAARLAGPVRKVADLVVDRAWLA
jgi:diaminopimelate epimerase